MYHHRPASNFFVNLHHGLLIVCLAYLLGFKIFCWFYGGDPSAPPPLTPEEIAAAHAEDLH